MSCPLPHVLILLNLLCRPAPLVVGRNGLAIGVGSVCDYGWRANVVPMSCDCGCLLLGSLTPRLPIAPLLDTDGGEGSGAIDVIVACFFRISPAMRDFCGSRSLRLPGLLPHGILSLCREGG